MGSKDWYWECESAEVLADEGLALISSPDGWPDEGLSCVGLYWLMLCVMHRSPRRGYLLDPTSGLPLTTAGLARMVRRSVQVVDRVQQVILTSGLFSADKHGTIYSRGMIKREELRQKRREAGSKGGAAAALLKQAGQQTPQQTLGVGMLEGNPRKEEIPKAGISLGALWIWLSRRKKGRTKAEDPDDAQAMFDEWQRAHGLTLAEIEAEISRDGRDKSESLGEFRQRWFREKGIVNGTVKPPGQHSRVAFQDGELDAIARKTRSG